MSRPCSICTHTACGTIDQALADGVSYRHIARHTGVSTASLVRHRQHGASPAPTDTVTVPEQVPRPCLCPCTRLDWRELAHDAKQLHAYMQQVQTQDEALHYMKFYLLRFAALIARATER